MTQRNLSFQLNERFQVVLHKFASRENFSHVHGQIKDAHGTFMDLRYPVLRGWRNLVRSIHGYPVLLGWRGKGRGAQTS